MSKKNFKLLGTGLVFLALAVFCGLAAFYFLEVKPELAKGELSTSVIPEVSVQPEKTSPQKPPTQKRSIPKDEIRLEALIEAAHEEYSDEEKQRKEGFLWIDKKSSQYIVTLGAINGLLPGSELSVYDDKEKLGQVIIETAFDVISYVRFADETVNLGGNKYFRVVNE